jgi:hypothetical protein
LSPLVKINNSQNHVIKTSVQNINLNGLEMISQVNKIITPKCIYVLIMNFFLNKLYDSYDEYDDNISFQKPESLSNDNYIQNEFDSNIV